jgi:hypothetical protein
METAAELWRLGLIVIAAHARQRIGQQPQIQEHVLEIRGDHL